VLGRDVDRILTKSEVDAVAAVAANEAYEAVPNKEPVKEAAVILLVVVLPLSVTCCKF
jgi:hypothetical protein